MRFEPKDWKGYCTKHPVLDVRSPAEYAQGHMPGAISFPLFSDEERREVGTIYKQENPEKAFTLGLSIAGPKMAGFVLKAIELAPERKVSIYCWRGGQRSSSMAWLLEQAGFQVNVLKGGYKAWRNHALDNLSSRTFPFHVVGGMTGVGKTEVIHALDALGQQVLDLEGMANHRGSAFGSRGLQPTVEQFENELFASLEQLDPFKPIWVEDESKSIGRVFLPLFIWEHMQQSPLFQIYLERV
jgi:tRNA 2-selenouridine synthase